jgi:hypothetical protein
MTKMTDKEQLKHLLKMEEQYLRTHRNLYLECLNNKLLKDRKTDEEIRDGLILFHHVFGVCVKGS